MIFNQENTLNLIIDIQEKLINSAFNKETILKNSEILAKTATILNIPTIITEQYPKGLGDTLSNVKQNTNNPLIFEKTDFNAFSNDAVIASIKKLNKKQIFVCGIETHICVLQTVLTLIEEGYNVAVIKDACGSRNEFEHLSGLSYLKSCGAHIITTEMLLFQLLKSSKHPNFKEIQLLIK